MKAGASMAVTPKAGLPRPEHMKAVKAAGWATEGVKPTRMLPSPHIPARERAASAGVEPKIAVPPQSLPRVSTE